MGAGAAGGVAALVLLVLLAALLVRRKRRRSRAAPVRSLAMPFSFDRNDSGSDKVQPEGVCKCDRRSRQQLLWKSVCIS